jgi:hypothetical protein
MKDEWDFILIPVGAQPPGRFPHPSPRGLGSYKILTLFILHPFPFNAAISASENPASRRAAS